MAFATETGQFTGSGTPGNQTVTLTSGATPVAIFLYSDFRSTTGNAQAFTCLGAATGTTQRWAAASVSRDAQATSDENHIFKSDACFIRLDTLGAVAGQADFVSFAAGQFTINWSNADAAVINYIAFFDCTPEAGTVDLTTASGDQTLTFGSAIDAKGIIFAGSALNTTETSQADAHMFVGASDGTNNAVIAVGGDDAVALGTAVTRRYTNTAACIANLTGAITALDVVASVTAFPTTSTATINKSDPPAATMRVGYLAIGGNGAIEVTNDTSRTSTTGTKKTALSNQPVGAMVFSAGSTASGNIDNHSFFFLGSTDGTTDEAILEVSGAVTTATDSYGNQSPSIFAARSSSNTLLSDAVTSSLDADGITLSYPATVEATARIFGLASFYASSSLGSITLTDVADRTVLTPDGSGEGSIAVSGTYSNGTSSITAVQYRVVNDGTDTAVTGHDWQTLDASPSGGTFSGTITAIPEGGWYNVDVRWSNETTVVSNGTNKFLVAILQPSDLGGLVADWNADSLALADGAAVASWDDDVAALTLTTPDTDGVYDDGSDYPHGHASVVMSNARLQITNAAFDLANATVAMIGTWRLDGGQMLLNKAATSAATLLIRLSQTVSFEDTLNFGYRDTGATFFEADGLTFHPQAMRMVGILQDGTKMQGFVDGEVVASDTRTVDLDAAPTGILSFGGHPTVTTSTCVESRLFRALYFNKGLTDAELTSLANWRARNYKSRFDNAASAILAANHSSPSAWLDGSTYHIFVTDETNDEFDYYTAPASDPSDWTLVQAGAYVPVAATRGSCIVKEGSTWYLFYDDRTSGHIEYASGSSLTTLTHQGRLFTGSAGNFYRHPAVVPPSVAKDGNWKMLIDVRTDSATGRLGDISTVSGATLGSLTETAGVITPSGVEGWDKSDMGSPSVKLIGTTYYAAIAGFNTDEQWGGRAPHAIGIWTSDDFATWTPYGDNPVLGGSQVAASWDANDAHEAEMLENGGLLYSAFDNTSPTNVAGTGYATLNFALPAVAGGSGSAGFLFRRRRRGKR